MDFRRIEAARRVGYPAPKYFGVYAVEGNKILSTVRVIRFPFTLPDDSVETATGIQGVASRRDKRRKGLAGRLLEEVHAREAGEGIRLSFLWTSRTNSAHHLYEKLGYRDIYTPDLAFRSSPRAKPKTPYFLTPAKKSDVALLERLYASSTRRRTGFVPRPRGLLRSLMELGFVKLDSIMMVNRGKEKVGYVEMQASPSWVKVSELVTTEARPDGDGLISAVELAASDKLLAFWNTLVRDFRAALLKRRYSVSDLAYYGLMATQLKGRKDNYLARTLGTASLRFSCQGYDYF